MRFQSVYTGVQAELDLLRLDYPCQEYIRLMIVSLLFYPMSLAEKRFLLIGLGGGTLARAIRRLYPLATIDIVEIDPVVLEMAKKRFSFDEDSRMKVFITDGRRFLQQQPMSCPYDIIVLDAYDCRSGMPRQMKTQDFFVELKDHLNRSGGLFIVNLVCIYQSYINVRRTIESVFGEEALLTFRSTDWVNMIAVASSSIEHFPDVLGSHQQLSRRKEMEQKLSIDIRSSLNRRQRSSTETNTSSKIYRDSFNDLDHEQEMSLTQFIQIV